MYYVPLTIIPGRLAFLKLDEAISFALSNDSYVISEQDFLIQGLEVKSTIGFQPKPNLDDLIREINCGC